MPKADFIHTDEYDHSIILGYEYLPDGDGTTSIERAYATLSSMYQQERAENERLRRSLDDIRRHQETMCPTGYKMSSAWVIANQALTPKETADE